MNKSFRSRRVLGSVLIAALPVLTVSAKDSGTEPGLKIIVRVYNYAHISPQTHAEAIGEAAKMFSEVGLETVWLDCRLSMEDAHGDKACRQPFGLTDFVLRILPRSKVKNYHDTTFGVSLPSSLEEERGFIADIFWNRIEGLTKWSQVSQSQVLGLVAAHELGHLLLGLNSHSPAGIMQATWSKRDLERASQGLLHFTPLQSEHIRAEVRARIEEQDALQASELESAR